MDIVSFALMFNVCFVFCNNPPLCYSTDSLYLKILALFSESLRKRGN